MEQTFDTADGFTIPVDPSGFDEDAWWARLEAELADRRPDEVEESLEIRASMSRLLGQEQRLLAALAAQARDGLFPTAASKVVGSTTATSKDVELAMRSLVAELAVAHRVSDRTMAARIAEAEALVSRFPATLECLESGSIQWGHVRVIVEQGIGIDDHAARSEYERVVLERAETVTPGRLRRFAQLTAVRVGESSFQERHDRAREQRGVIVTELGDGMSQIVHILPTMLAEAVWDRLTQQAKAISQAGDVRTFDQIRSDLAAELLLTGQPSRDPDAPHAAGIGIRAEVSITIPMLSLLGESEEPATIVGKGPIDMATATKIAAEAPELVRILTHPVTGMVLAVDSYRPSERLRRFLRLRDGRCRFPSCNRSARRCDIDHTTAWENGGRTEPGNLACLCRGHHTMKHLGGWSVRQLTPGVLEWTSPRGRIYTDEPDTAVRFS